MTANDIRNIALLGHGGSGKTSLAEQMLFMTKGTDRLGRTADGNTTCDYDAEEIKRQISISLAFAPVNYKGVKINVMDAPGNFDFSGEALSAIRAAECAVLVGAAKDGLSVGMERSWKMLGKKPRMIFINRTDEDNSDYASCLDALKGKFGQAIAPIVAPVIDGNKKVTAIVDLLIGGLNKRLADKQLKVILTPAAKSYVIDNGYDPLYGARPLRRFLQHTVETLVGRKMIADEVAPGSTLTVDCVAGELVVH